MFMWLDYLVTCKWCLSIGFMHFGVRCCVRFTKHMPTSKLWCFAGDKSLLISALLCLAIFTFRSVAVFFSFSAALYFAQLLLNITRKHSCGRNQQKTRKIWQILRWQKLKCNKLHILHNIFGIVNRCCLWPFSVLVCGGTHGK